jgi:outer membrane protein insertion porin family
MKLLFLLAALFVADVCSAQPKRAPRKPAPAAATTTTPPETAWPIASINVQGNRYYTAAQILAVTDLHIGQKAGKPEFEAARERLLVTGAFDNVGYRYAPAKEGKGYDATFEVSEIGQMYPMRFEDLPASDTELRAWLKKKDPLFGEKMPPTKPVLDRYVRWISEYLAPKNYHEPLIGKLTPDASPDLTVVFRPAKPRPNVARVKFTNTGDLPAGMLQTAMYGVAIGIPYVEPAFRVLLENAVRPLYEARGMIRVTFPKIETEPAKDVDGVDVTVQVEQGSVYKLGRVSFSGAGSSEEEFPKLANLKSNQPVNFDQVKAAQSRIAEMLRRGGYMQAGSEVKRAVHDADHTVDLTFQIQPGPRFSMGTLTIVGLDIESEPVIRKMWGLQTGKPFNVDYPERFLNRVKEDGVFDNLKNTRAETKVNAADRTVDVTLYFNK